VSRLIDGPLGPFEIPDSPEATRRVCEDIARDVWRGEYWHPALPPRVRRIVDIGAGWGAFAVWALSQWPGAEIDCYEPHAAACEYLRRNAPTARVHQVAVTTRDQAVLSVGSHDTLDNWGARTIVGVTSGESVAVLHPRDLPAVDLLKVDAEMVETEVLENYLHMAGVSVLLYEFHTADDRVRLSELARNAGFRCLRSVQTGGHDERLVWGPTVWIRDNFERRIPKIIHQIWIGPLPPPSSMMETWKAHHPDWQYKLWTSEKGWGNQDKIDAMPEWNGKADIMRWEILWREGGVLVDADSICVQPLDEAFLQHDNFACWENESVRPGLIAAGYVGAAPGSLLMRKCIETVASRPLHGPAWQCVGPGLLTEVADETLHVFPARMFIPRHYTGVAAPGDAPVYATQHWGSTVGYDRIVKLYPANTDGPTVSVVIPCFRQARYLGDAIRSVKAQTYKNVEIIVAAGDDESYAMAKRHKVHVVRDGGRGLANARNVAIAEASGEFVLPLDADDAIAPDFLSKTAPLAREMTIVGTLLQEFGARSRVIGLPTYDRRTIFEFNPTFVCSLFPKALWREVGGYNVAPFGYEDWDFWISCCLRGAKILRVEEPLFRYRIHDGQGSQFCIEHDEVLRAMIGALHPGHAPKHLRDYERVVEAMPDAVRDVMKRRQAWFPDNSTITRWLCLRA